MTRRIAVVVAAAVAVALAGCAPGTTTTTTTTSTTPAPATTSVAPTTTTTASGVYTAKLDPVNSSGVSGNATVTVNGSTAMVTISATGMVPNKLHAQHIHALPGSTPSTCPPAVQGTITPETAAEKYYGPVVVPLEPFPTADTAGTIAYSASVTSLPAGILPLTGRAVVLHGLVVNGAYDPSVPVACGELAPATATTTSPSGQAPGTGGTTGGSAGTSATGSGTTSGTGGTGGGTSGGGAGGTTYTLPGGGTIKVPPNAGATGAAP